MKKKIFFIHVAKTAGSSFNKFLANNFVGESHCEQYLDSQTVTLPNLDSLKKLEYISGHLNFFVFARNFAREEYFALTFLREPIDQLISHINWVIHIYDIGSDFFQAHPKNIQDLSLELRAANLYDSDTFISCLSKYDWLFQNCQSRYFVEDWQNLRSMDVIENLATLDMVGLTEFYERSLQKFVAANQLEVEVKVDFLNQNSEYKIKKDICENALIHEFIQTYNKVDIEVYAYALEQFMRNS
ncbi:MAG: sulfotransferase family 2 domain-containing protein [Oscillatoriophycideae cyanobacterium NC_groundwater_1537_Pr4_S-0.65um_50_18]|nr:sulfotransferase family 2 domain-containing protein [Oscillatoriophycideae cyanobacterium NC_groundwater_1537_Pr4_S-0.65um_50_18]